MKALIPDSLLVHSVEIEAYTGRGRSGPEYAPSVTSGPAYIEETATRVITQGGEEKQGKLSVYFKDPAGSPPLGSRLVYNGQHYIVEMREIYDTPFGGYSMAVGV